MASTAEPSLWQRTLALFTSAQPPAPQRIAPVDVPLPMEKLRLEPRGGATTSPRRPVVLVACGSFNPPTLAHLRMFDLAEHALAEARFAVLEFIFDCIAYSAPSRSLIALSSRKRRT